MFELELSDEDRTWMRALGVSTAPDTRTGTEAEERFVMPAWLRRAMWRKFLVDHGAVGKTIEQAAPGELFDSRTGSRFSEHTVGPGLVRARVPSAVPKGHNPGFPAVSSKENGPTELILLDDVSAKKCFRSGAYGAVFFLAFCALIAALCLFLYVIA